MIPAEAEAQRVFSRVMNADLASASLTVCLASSPAGGNPHYQRLSITDTVRVEFENVIRSARELHSSADFELREYYAGSKPDAHEVEYLRLADADFIVSQFTQLMTLIDLPLFTGADDRFLSDLRFYAIAQQSNHEDPAYWFRLYSRHKELQHSRLFGIMMQRGQFDHVREPMFLFDQYLDCVATGGWLFVFRQDNFQKIFRYYESVRRAAAQSLTRIETVIPIENFEAFRHDCEAHVYKLAKLRNIAEKPYLDHLTMNDLKRVIRRFGLPIEITRDRGRERLVYDNSDRWAILRLLDDDYLDSMMTKQMYEVTGKRAHRRGESAVAG